MNNPPITSVIIPVHNRFDLAERAIDSVVNQTYSKVQILVVDDGSAVPFKPSIRDLSAGKSIEVFRFDSNRGPGAAREEGRLHAEGEYIAYLDSDDFWRPEFLSVLVSALEGDEKVGMVYCTAVCPAEAASFSVVKLSDKSYDRLLPTVLWGRPWHTSGCLWRRSVTDRLGPWLPLWNWEDYEYDCRAGCLEVEVWHVNKPLCIVQQDAPGRISETSDDEKRTRSISISLHSMSERVRTTRYALDERIQSRLSIMLISDAVALLHSNMRLRANKSLYLGWTWSVRRIRLALPFLVTTFLVSVGAQAEAVRLMRWLRAQHGDVSGVEAAIAYRPSTTVNEVDLVRSEVS